MDRDKEIHRLKKIIIWQNMFVLLILTIVVIAATMQLRRLRQDVQLAASKQPTIVRGINGKDGEPIIGPQGIPGYDGVNGKTGEQGKNVTPEQIASAVSEYLKINPVSIIQGPQGADGKDGKTLQLQIDPLTCVLKSKYVTDAFWDNVAQLPLPCGATP